MVHSYFCLQSNVWQLSFWFSWMRFWFWNAQPSSKQDCNTKSIRNINARLFYKIIIPQYYLNFFLKKPHFFKLPRFHNPITGFWKTNSKWPFTFFNFHHSQRKLSSLQLQIFQSQYRSNHQTQKRKIGKFSWWILCAYWNFCFVVHDFIFHWSRRGRNLIIFFWKKLNF